jgi:hypothetical protein
MFRVVGVFQELELIEMVKVWWKQTKNKEVSRDVNLQLNK